MGIEQGRIVWKWVKQRAQIPHERSNIVFVVTISFWERQQFDRSVRLETLVLLVWSSRGPWARASQMKLMKKPSYFWDVLTHPYIPGAALYSSKTALRTSRVSACLGHVTKICHASPPGLIRLPIEAILYVWKSYEMTRLIPNLGTLGALIVVCVLCSLLQVEAHHFAMNFAWFLAVLSGYWPPCWAPNSTSPRKESPPDLPPRLSLTMNGNPIQSNRIYRPSADGSYRNRR